MGCCERWWRRRLWRRRLRRRRRLSSSRGRREEWEQEGDTGLCWVICDVCGQGGAGIKTRFAYTKSLKSNHPGSRRTVDLSLYQPEVRRLH